MPETSAQQPKFMDTLHRSLRLSKDDSQVSSLDQNYRGLKRNNNDSPIN